MRGQRKAERRFGAETQLVTDLLARLQPYEAQGVMCRRCRTWVTQKEAQAIGWSHWHGAAGDTYLCCPECAKHEYQHGLPLEDENVRAIHPLHARP